MGRGVGEGGRGKGGEERRRGGGYKKLKKRGMIENGRRGREREGGGTLGR